MEMAEAAAMEERSVLNLTLETRLRVEKAYLAKHPPMDPEDERYLRIRAIAEWQTGNLN